MGKKTLNNEKKNNKRNPRVMYNSFNPKQG